jgi:formate-dependent nitrite reductase membrane component NrfD
LSAPVAGRTSDGSPESSLAGYYGVPVIHRPHWKWLVVGYFFFGGISGSTAAIGAVARLAGGGSGRAIARYATYVSFAALLPCPPLLILDLGRPARFLNMLRVFRPSSPMSVGSWALAAFGAVNTLNASLQLANELVQPPTSAPLPTQSAGYPLAGGWDDGRCRRAPLSTPETTSPFTTSLAVASGALGFFVAGYTGVLLAATAVPLWSKRPALLGPLFLSSAMSSGAAAIGVAAALTRGIDEEGEARLQNLEGVATIAEGLALAAWIGSLGTTARALQTGPMGTVVRHLVVGTGIVLPMVLTGIGGRVPRRYHRPLAGLASALTLAGGFALRYAVVEGGRLSADDPHATFEMTS